MFLQGAGGKPCQRGPLRHGGRTRGQTAQQAQAPGKYFMASTVCLTRITFFYENIPAINIM